jgi:hypothetical protein
VDYFSAGPSPIQELTFVTRTPKRLFEALRGQPQLKCLQLKWGDYEDLSALEGMQELRTLVLGGASSVRTLAPLARLHKVGTLSVDSLRHAHDLSPIGLMGGVTSLDLGGDWGRCSPPAATPTALVDPADHRQVQMQIHRHELLGGDTVAHGGLLFYGCCEHSESSSENPQERRPRPVMAYLPSPTEVAAYVGPMSYLRSLARLDQRLMPGLRQPGESAEDFLRRTARMFRFRYSDVGRALREHFEHLDAERRQNE